MARRYVIDVNATLGLFPRLPYLEKSERWMQERRAEEAQPIVPTLWEYECLSGFQDAMTLGQISLEQSEGESLSTQVVYPPPEVTKAPRINPTMVPGVTVVLEGDLIISDLTPLPTLGPPKIVAHEYFASATALPIIPVADTAEGELKYLSRQNKGMSSTNTVLTTKDGELGLAKSGIDLPVPEFGDVSRSPNGEWIVFSDNNSNVTFFKPDDAGSKGTTIDLESTGRFLGWHPDQIHFLARYKGGFYLFDVTSLPAKAGELLGTRLTQRPTLCPKGCVPAERSSHLGGSNLTCGPSPHSLQSEVCKVPHQSKRPSFTDLYAYAIDRLSYFIKKEGMRTIPLLTLNGEYPCRKFYGYEYRNTSRDIF